MQIDLTEQESSFLEDYIRAELEQETLSRTSQKILTNLLIKLTQNESNL